MGSAPQEILERAYSQTTVRGSSTACVAVLNGDSLGVSNLGDSGLLILRAGAWGGGGAGAARYGSGCAFWGLGDLRT